MLTDIIVLVPLGVARAARCSDASLRDPEGSLRDPEGDARYAAALDLVQAIDHDLQKGTRHYRDGRGRLLLSLDTVVSAMLRDDLVLRPAPQSVAIPEREVVYG